MHALQFRSLRSSLAVAVAAAGLAAPAAVAGIPQDLRSPDTRDVAAGRTSYEPAKPLQDLRSPDTVDAAAGRTAPNVLVVKVPEPVPATGIDWAGVGIGAGGLLGLTLVSFGGTMLVAHRKRRVSAAV